MEAATSIAAQPPIFMNLVRKLAPPQEPFNFSTFQLFNRFAKLRCAWLRQSKNLSTFQPFNFFNRLPYHKHEGAFERALGSAAGEEVAAAVAQVGLRHAVP